MKKEKISSSLEDYLEAIAEIIETNGHAHTKDIAQRMNVKMPSVSNALQLLSSKGLIQYQSHMPVVLTPLGSQLAAVIRLRHSALKTFFSEVLKLPEAEADTSACEVEHILGENVMARVVLLTEALLKRPDCASLREYLLQAMPKAGADSPGQDLDLISLRDLEEGECGCVALVDCPGKGSKKIADIGIVPGSLISMEGRAPFGGLLRIKVMGSHLMIHCDDAAHIWIRRTE